MSQARSESEGPNIEAVVERASVGALEGVGRKVNAAFEYIGGVTALGGEAAVTIFRLRIRFAETVNQCFLLGYQSLIIVLLTSLFTGMVFSLESAVQAVQYGFGTFVGGIVSYTNVRELGPMLTAVVVAGRVCAAIAAELGSMVVTEQIEALQSLGLAPVRFLVVPRLLSLMIMLPLLTVFADVIGVMGGQWIAHAQAHISYDDFMSSGAANRSASKTSSKGCSNRSSSASSSRWSDRIRVSPRAAGRQAWASQPPARSSSASS